MEKLSKFFNTIWEKFKALGKGIRIVIIVALVSFLIAIISLFVYSGKNKYQVLFSGLEANDAQTVTTKLQEEKVDVKIEGDKILVPKDKVDELRLSLAPELKSGSTGYELMDSGSSFGMTEDEFKIKKQRMLQGELERTIKSFSQVEDARIHISEAKDSVFVEDKEPGKAAVYLKLASGNTLTVDQVKSIVALVSGSTSNIPKENVEVIDEKMNLLTSNLNGENGNTVTSGTIEEQYKLEENYEKTLQGKIIALLEPVIGKNKIKATVNVDMDFDSKHKTETIIDPNKVIVSQQTIIEVNGTGSQVDLSGSPVDNNMTNNIEDEDGEGAYSSKEDQTTNYESGKTQTEVISAPGEVKRLTASVVVDGNIDANLQSAIESAVGTAIGFDDVRGDAISVFGMNFDPEMKAEAEKEAEIFAQMEKTARTKRLITLSILGLAIIAIIVIIILLIRKKKNQNDEDDNRLVDVVIDDRVNNIETEPMPTIDFGENSVKAQFETEIKKYAKEKPEQVSEIVKSWLSEDERW